MSSRWVHIVKKGFEDVLTGSLDGNKTVKSQPISHLVKWAFFYWYKAVLNRFLFNDFQGYFVVVMKTTMVNFN